MKIKLSLFLAAFIIGILGVLIFKSNRALQENSQNETNTSCRFEESKEVFSKKNYFSKEEATQLLGKKVRNLKCGKIKCPVRANSCMNVEINELGKIASLKPRVGFDDYILIIEWNEPQKVKDNSLAEQGLDTYVSYIGKDNSYLILDN